MNSNTPCCMKVRHVKSIDIISSLRCVVVGPCEVRVKSWANAIIGRREKKAEAKNAGLRRRKHSKFQPPLVYQQRVCGSCNRGHGGARDQVVVVQVLTQRIAR